MYLHVYIWLAFQLLKQCLFIKRVELCPFRRSVTRAPAGDLMAVAITLHVRFARVPWARGGAVCPYVFGHHSVTIPWLMFQPKPQKLHSTIFRAAVVADLFRHVRFRRNIKAEMRKQKKSVALNDSDNNSWIIFNPCFSSLCSHSTAVVWDFPSMSEWGKPSVVCSCRSNIH